jgi:hypothetical protein
MMNDRFYILTSQIDIVDRNTGKAVVALQRVNQAVAVNVTTHGEPIGSKEWIEISDLVKSVIDIFER